MTAGTRAVSSSAGRLHAVCAASRAWGDGGRGVLTTRVEQRQRFRQREGLEERPPVGGAVEGCIYGATVDKKVFWAGGGVEGRAAPPPQIWWAALKGPVRKIWLDL